MSNTKCGCPDCRGQAIPQTKWQWKARKNRYGRPYGIGSGKVKPKKSKQVRHHIIL
jgi:hypothetical protein